MAITIPIHNKVGETLLTKDDILVVKNHTEIIVCFNGVKLVKSVEGFEDKSEQDIIEWFLKEVNSS